ncbi:MAG: DUF488 family protein, N3 subclade [Acidimicrobiales bacterium]
MRAMVSKSAVEVVRVYEDPGRKPGEHRVLVDRLWPRGLTKAAVDFDARGGNLVLLTATRDVEHSGAVVLRALVEDRDG